MNALVDALSEYSIAHIGIRAIPGSRVGEGSRRPRAPTAAMRTPVAARGDSPRDKSANDALGRQIGTFADERFSDM
jgi:hypothetical protein